MAMNGILDIFFEVNRLQLPPPRDDKKIRTHGYPQQVGNRYCKWIPMGTSIRMLTERVRVCVYSYLLYSNLNKTINKHD